MTTKKLFSVKQDANSFSTGEFFFFCGLVWLGFEAMNIFFQNMDFEV